VADPARVEPGPLSGTPTIEGLLRELAPQVLGALVRRHGQFDLAEDATQEALLAATVQWPTEGVPDNPRGWLVTVGSRRLLDEMRSEHARRRREENSSPAERPEVDDSDDSLTLLFLCCHPALSVPSQIALTLRAVGGLTTAQIAAAFLVPEATMAQRISRAKQTIRAEGLQGKKGDLAVVLHVLYLIFNEGYTTSSGEDLTVPRLSDEAIRLTRWLHRLAPEDPEVTGLLALMLLTDARRPARTAADGSLVPLAEQDRGRWDAAAIAEGVALVTAALPKGRVGPYQLQAAIAAVHDEAAHVDDTDWVQILGLYDLLERVAPGPLVTLNRAVAVAMVRGPEAGLALLTTLAAEARMARHHRLLATRAFLRDLAGDPVGAAADYRLAAKHATSLPERRHLSARAARRTQ
jgi:RNA polymerase sigma factor (sigma-70 family)